MSNSQLPTDQLDNSLFGVEQEFMQKHGLNLPGGLKDTLIVFLRHFFAQQSEYTWRDDEHETDLIIADSYPEDLQVSEHKPKIITNRGAIRKANLTIDDKQSPSFGLRGNADHGSEYSDLFTTTMRFNCFAKEGLEAERLATRVMISIMTMREILRKQGIHDYQEITIEQEANVEADAEIDEMVVPVLFRFHAKFDWQVELESEELDSVQSTIQIQSSPCEQDFLVGLDIDNNN